MNKKLKAIIEFLKVHKKESIGVAVAVGIAVIGIGGYVINSYYSKNNIEKNNIALAEKKEDTTKADENNELDKENQEETTTESDVVVEEKEDGTLIVKDKEGNTKPNNSTGGTESNSKPSINNESSNNPNPPVENKPVDKPNNDSSNNKPQDKPVEQVPTPKPPTENKPVEKPQEPVKPVRTWEYQAEMSNELLNLISDFRQANGLNTLNHSGAMAQATKQHCEEMAQNGATFHKDDADEWVQNVAMGTNVSAQGILNMWKASSGHRQALLDKDIKEGVCAVYRDSDGDYYAVFNGNF
ncbi:CAP domain-containing protein (plasmid) [Clostridium perfringens]